MESNKELATIPYFVHQGCIARDERVIKRLVITLVFTIILMFASNGLWLYAWMQYDYVSETTSTTTTTTQDGEGVNVYGGGDVNYGTDDNSNDREEDAEAEEEKR